MVSGVSATSLIACSAIDLRWPVVRCVAASKTRIDFQRVAEEIEPQRSPSSRREEIEDAAAHREFADVAHRRHPLEAGNLQPRHQRVHVDLVAGSCVKGLRLDQARRRNALQQRIGGGRG